jgi:hypothetical protein
MTRLHVVGEQSAGGVAGPNSPYAELVWLPVLGPSSFLLWRHLARRLQHTTAGFTVAVDELSAALGLGVGNGTQSPMTRTVRRVQRFGAARFDAPNVLTVLTALPPAPRHQLTRLHPIVLCHHERLLAQRDSGNGESRSRRVRPLAGGQPLPC